MGWLYQAFWGFLVEYPLADFGWPDASIPKAMALMLVAFHLGSDLSGSGVAHNLISNVCRAKKKKQKNNSLETRYQ